MYRRVPSRALYRERSLSIILSFASRAREPRHPLRGLHWSPPSQPARYAMNKPMLSITANSSAKFACLPSLDVNPSPRKRVHFRPAVTRPEKSCPDWERARFRDNGSSRESSDTHVSRANSRHVFVLNSDAVEEVPYVIELKARERERVEQRCHS